LYFSGKDSIMKHHFVLIAILAAVILGSASGAALADERQEHRGRQPAPRLQLDQRYHHDHYYPARGYAVAALPAGSISIGFGPSQFFFHSGVWFRPLGGRFEVILPPLGIIIPVLPPAYVTLMIGGAPYYYANGVYYAAAQQGYAVVAAPPGAETAQPLPPAAVPVALPAPIIYPRNGQSVAQTQADQQECSRWAAAQPNATVDASVFQRSVSACMDGRGYTVR
jgi:Family of unknown function (DUF6515)